MGLNSQWFLLAFLPLAAVIAAGVGRRLHDRTYLLGAISLAFYSFAGYQALLLLVAMAGVTALAASNLAAATAPRRRVGAALLAVNVVVLVAFKLSGLLSTASGVKPEYPVFLGLALPLGLSFYTFNLMSHGLDVYWGRTAPAAFPRLLAYAAFFPTVSSGPVMRQGDFDEQASRPARLTAAGIDTAVLFIAIGLAKKVLVADSLAGVVDPLFATPDALRLGTAWAAVAGEHFRVYFDFAGYTDIAIGAALLVGIRVPPNFDAPYTARSLTEFWQRWHMSLSLWFREYVFMPVSVWLRRQDPKRRNAPARSLALLITMALIGLWHAPTGPYLLWGLSQGVILAVHAAMREQGRRPWPVWLARGATTLALLAGWALLRSPDLGSAATVFAALIGNRGAAVDPASPVTWPFIAMLAVLAVVTGLGLERRLTELGRSWAVVIVVALLATWSILSLGHERPFVYLQF